VHNTVEAVVLGLSGVRLLRKREPTGLLGLYPETVKEKSPLDENWASC